MRINEDSRLLWREIAAIVFLSLLLALVCNFFSPNGLPLIRAVTTKMAVSDSVLFAQVGPPQTLARDTANRSTVSSGVSSLRGSPATDSIETGRSQNPDAIETISLGQVRQLLEQRRALIIDARDTDSYKKAHIRGAMNMFGDELGQHFDDLTKISPDTLIVVYCNGPDCHLGRSLIKFMKAMEFKHLFLYDDGWDEWQKANMPVEKSSPG